LTVAKVLIGAGIGTLITMGLNEEASMNGATEMIDEIDRNNCSEQTDTFIRLTPQV
jgi:hypothetical protein